MFKMMVVEDDLTIAKTISEHLGKWGYDVTYVTDFRNVAEQVKQLEPQLILLDIALPFYNGFHWCNEIRKFSKVPIMFISSASDNMNIVMAMNMGGDDFIAKPFDLHVLTAKVGALLTESVPVALRPGRRSVASARMTSARFTSGWYCAPVGVSAIARPLRRNSSAPMASSRV